MFVLSSIAETFSLIEFLLEYWWLVLLIAILFIAIVIAIVKWGFRLLIKLIARAAKYLLIGLAYIIISPILLVIGIIKLIRFINGTEKPRKKKTRQA